MPTVLPERALAKIEPILHHLIGVAEQFSPEIQQQIEELYARMRREAFAAQDPLQRGMAVARFLAALDELSEVHAVLGAAIAPTRGELRRSARPIADTSVLDRLPPSLRNRDTAIEALGSPMAGSLPREALAPPGAPPSDALLPPAPEPIESLGGDGGAPPGVDSTRELRARPPAAAEEPEAPGATRRAAPSAAAGSSLTRYPSLEYPREAVLGARTSLLVVLEVQQREPASVAMLVADTEPEPPVLEIVVRARAFDIEDSNTQLLEVGRDGDSDVRFVLVPRQTGEQEIRVDFYQYGRRIGTARHIVQITAKAASIPVRSERVAVEPIEIGRSEAVAPDLELCVEADRNDPRMLYFSLHSTVEDVDLHHAHAGAVRLQGSPLEKMEQVYSRLSRFAGQAPPSQGERMEQLAELEQIGRNLWDELVPDELKAGYWRFKDRISSLLVTSDEPWIPWEIIKPYRWDDGNRLVDEPFWCEKFSISRWLSGPGPADRVPMRYLRPVAPAVSNLPSVQAELAFLRAINLLDVRVLADEPFSERGPVIDLFANGRFNVLHIAAHGGFNASQPDDSRIMLDGGELRPADILAHFGGARPRPLIFINACHGARIEHAFTGLGGWADRLVRGAHVAAFVGTAWEVNDRLALLFAQAFYEALLRDGKTLGESFLLARRRIRDADPSNSTWLAYVLYADPGAHAALVANGVTV